MSRVFNSLSSLLDDLQLNVEIIAEEKLLPKGIEETWYAAYERTYTKPSKYQRTFELLQSITGDVERLSENAIRINVYHDHNIMSDPHASWVDGSDQREHIAKWMNEGHGGIVSYKESKYLELADTRFSRSAQTELNKELKKLGIKTTRRS